MKPGGVLLVQQEFLELLFQQFVFALEAGDEAKGLFQDLAQAQAAVHARRRGAVCPG